MTPEQLAESIAKHSRADELMAQSNIQQGWPSCDCGAKINPETIWASREECKACFVEGDGPYEEDDDSTEGEL